MNEIQKILRKMPPTCLETERCVPRGYVESLRRLWSRDGVDPLSRAAGVQVHLRAGQEGHEAEPLVWVELVDSEQTERGREVSEGRAEPIRAPVHHAGVHECRYSVQLLPVTEGKRTAGSRTEKRHADLSPSARVGERDLNVKKKKQMFRVCTIRFSEDFSGRLVVVHFKD